MNVKSRAIFNKSLTSVFCLVVLTACQTQGVKHDIEITQSNKAKNIILMIGDGMGLAQVSAAAQDQTQLLNLERATIVGLSKTGSSKQEITDSAAGATAFSIGLKTYNGAIGVDPDGNSKVTILEQLSEQGYSTGLVATSSITHATPASFYAHTDSRKNYYEIAAQMASSPVTLFIGGGKKHFYDRVDPNVGPSDDRNLLTEMSTAGVSMIGDLSELDSHTGRAAYFLAEGHSNSILDGRDDVLPRSMLPSIAFLQKQSSEGFFLMVEGSQIDWGGHKKDYDYVISELIDFDDALGKVLEFAEKDGNTLVVVTADHETGGLSLRASNPDDGRDGYEQADHNFSTNGHTSIMVPVFAFGKGAEHFAGVYENTAIYQKMLDAIGVK